MKERIKSTKWCNEQNKDAAWPFAVLPLEKKGSRISWKTFIYRLFFRKESPLFFLIQTIYCFLFCNLGLIRSNGFFWAFFEVVLIKSPWVRRFSKWSLVVNVFYLKPSARIGLEYQGQIFCFYCTLWRYITKWA